MPDEMAKKLSEIGEGVARIDERTIAMDKRLSETGEHLEKLIDQERQDRVAEFKLVRADLKRLPAIIGGIVSAAVAGIGQIIGLKS